MNKAAVEEPTISSFEIIQNTLIANVELYWENHGEFLKYCDKLVQSNYENITLDFSHVNFIFSAYMGTIGRLVTEVVKANKHLTIRVNHNLEWLFEIVGFENIVDIECVN